LSQLEAFYWISRLGSFHAAADHLGLTQPSISQRIRKLEDSVGAQVIQRNGTHCELTADGAALLDYAERLLRLGAEASERVMSRDPLRGRLRIGMPDSFALVCLARLTGLLEQDYPSLKAAIIVDNSTTLSDLLDRRQLEVAVLAQSEVGNNVYVDDLGGLEHAWVAHPRLDMPLGQLGPQQLVHQHIITNPHPSKLYSITETWFSAGGVEPYRLSTCNNLHVISRMVAAGMGASILPLPILRSELAAGLLRILPTTPEIPTQRIHVACLRDSVSQGILAVMDTVRRVVDETHFLVAIPAKPHRR